MVKPTIYFDEFLRYYNMAKTQQEECNLGTIPHAESSVDDDLMKHVHLYDVVERKYAGFSQILWDLMHGEKESHPYSHKLNDTRRPICQKFGHQDWSSETWFYVFAVHRLTGSAINYAKNPSGYHNTILPELHDCRTIDDMVKKIREHQGPMYTSIGYQFPSFPKPIDGYKRGGDYFICEMLPSLIKLLPYHQKTFRSWMDDLANWNKQNNLRVYWFQYAAFLADIADHYPDLVDPTSLFFYGTNAKECLSYLADKPDFDRITMMACEATGGNPYDVEDVCCDFIRWIENYCRKGADYDHLDLDKIWNSSKIDHPHGRRKK